MAKQYDLVVIGAGTAAMTAAMRVRAAGKQVAVVDFRPFGGTCALRGCDPKKMLIGGAEAVDHVRRMHDKGVAGDVNVMWPALMAFKRTFTDPVPDKMQQRYQDKNIDTFHGKSRFTGATTLGVGDTILEAKHILLASGAEPAKLNIPGEEYLDDNEDFLALETLHGRIVCVGGGYIAAEFSHLAARAGAKVTVLQHGERILKEFDADLVGWLMASFSVLGIDVHTKTSVERIEKVGNGYRVFSSSEGKESMVEADLVVHSAGRAPDYAALDLDAAGVDVQKGKIQLNEYLQSVSNPAVYAAGDAAKSLARVGIAHPKPHVRSLAPGVGRAVFPHAGFNDVHPRRCEKVDSIARGMRRHHVALLHGGDVFVAQVAGLAHFNMKRGSNPAWGRRLAARGLLLRLLLHSGFQGPGGGTVRQREQGRQRENGGNGAYSAHGGSFYSTGLIGRAKMLYPGAPASSLNGVPAISA